MPWPASTPRLSTNKWRRQSCKYTRWTQLLCLKNKQQGCQHIPWCVVANAHPGRIRKHGSGVTPVTSLSALVITTPSAKPVCDADWGKFKCSRNIPKTIIVLWLVDIHHLVLIYKRNHRFKKNNSKSFIIFVYLKNDLFSPLFPTVCAWNKSWGPPRSRRHVPKRDPEKFCQNWRSSFFFFLSFFV